MDGNRRWAAKSNVPSGSGHRMGKRRFIDVLDWCLQAGVKTVTVYAWSLENFKRSSAEVNEIMKIGQEEAERMWEEVHIIHSNRVRVRFLGDLQRVPTKLRQNMTRIMRETMRYRDGPVLNICFSYTSRYDMANAVADLSTIVRNRGLSPDVVTDEAVAACLSTGWAKGGDACMHPQLVVRTSGETRLSDFLLYECSESVLCFYPVLWPDLTAWDFVKILLEYQSSIKRASLKQCNCNFFEEGTGGMDPSLKQALICMRKEHFEELGQCTTEHSRETKRTESL
ncbi:Dehydrodolichyl diphosphate synthase complex subunit DHDDS [Gracilariopsis chorda]|uniref:Alkyl transferase n=1 Tax=Gracilariopsis chorda TaxID=448386 RepID=A0A2V3INX9_9FLOR|nr:Dehydrodolichyl diphosphate synthase complex subunit DHDDS [Gracilariopsis chorda]|eukprot:PXF43788.1 Dehydrodolichyl diphosphate synthase complex subunit DHDDS [Gracilariopsis chorda]